MGIEWHRVERFEPPQGKLVMVTGPSGYVTHTKFLALAYIDDEYRPRRDGPPRWQTVTNDSLSDFGWYPTHWAFPIDLPDPEDGL